MAVTTEISRHELKRLAAAAYEGKRIRVSLAVAGETGYDVNSTRANWDSVKISGNGYADFTDIVEVGAYDTLDLRYEMGGAVGSNSYINAEFTATGSGYTFDIVYVVIGTSNGTGGWTEETYVHSIITESPSITLVDGQSRTYQIQLVLDD